MCCIYVFRKKLEEDKDIKNAKKLLCNLDTIFNETKKELLLDKFFKMQYICDEYDNLIFYHVSEYNKLLALSPNHPDVVYLKKKIETLLSMKDMYVKKGIYNLTP